MRKGLTRYGDEGFSLFLRKAFIKAMGFSDDALDRPIVGIADTGSDYNACHASVPRLVEAVKRGVMLAGGLPMAFPTISLHESFSHPTSMFLRNLMAMDTEEMVRAQPMDAVVLIGGCDKTIPAQLMAAASADVPDPRPPHRADDDRALPGRAARGVHRLPPLLGHVPGGRARRRRDRGRERPARPHRGDLHGDGDRKHDGLHDGGARHDAAGRAPRSPPCTRTGSGSPSARDGARSRSPPRTSARSGS